MVFVLLATTPPIKPLNQQIVYQQFSENTQQNVENAANPYFLVNFSPRSPSVK
jgi:hypothetical protein